MPQAPGRPPTTRSNDLSVGGCLGAAAMLGVIGLLALGPAPIKVGVVGLGVAWFVGFRIVASPDASPARKAVVRLAAGLVGLAFALAGISLAVQLFGGEIGPNGPHHRTRRALERLVAIALTPTLLGAGWAFLALARGQLMARPRSASARRLWYATPKTTSAGPPPLPSQVARASTPTEPSPPLLAAPPLLPAPEAPPVVQRAEPSAARDPAPQASVEPDPMPEPEPEPAAATPAPRAPAAPAPETDHPLVRALERARDVRNEHDELEPRTFLSSSLARPASDVATAILVLAEVPERERSHALARFARAAGLFGCRPSDVARLDGERLWRSVETLLYASPKLTATVTAALVQLADDHGIDGSSTVVSLLEDALAPSLRSGRADA